MNRGASHARCLGIKERDWLGVSCVCDSLLWEGGDWQRLAHEYKHYGRCGEN